MTSDPNLVEKHGLTRGEYNTIVETLGRAYATAGELESAVGLFERADPRGGRLVIEPVDPPEVADDVQMLHGAGIVGKPGFHGFEGGREQAGDRPVRHAELCGRGNAHGRLSEQSSVAELGGARRRLTEFLERVIEPVGGLASAAQCKMQFTTSHGLRRGRHVERGERSSIVVRRFFEAEAQQSVVAGSRRQPRGARKGGYGSQGKIVERR